MESGRASEGCQKLGLACLLRVSRFLIVLVTSHSFLPILLWSQNFVWPHQLPHSYSRPYSATAANARQRMSRFETPLKAYQQRHWAGILVCPLGMSRCLALSLCATPAEPCWKAYQSTKVSTGCTHAVSMPPQNRYFNCSCDFSHTDFSLPAERSRWLSIGVDFEVRSDSCDNGCEAIRIPWATSNERRRVQRPLHR